MTLNTNSQTKINRIALVQPPNPHLSRVMRDSMGKFGILEKSALIRRTNVFPPLDLAYAASVLEKNGFEVSIIDASALALNKSEVLKRIIRFQADIIIVNTTPVSFSHDVESANWLKVNTSSLTGVIVPYTKFTHDNPLDKTEIDFLIRGELEYTVLELCKNFPNLESVLGLSFKKDGKVIENPDRPFISNLDELPFPAWHLLQLKKYSHGMLKKKPLVTFLATRGCPYGCIYCAYPIGYGEFWRRRSVENVLEELRWLKEKFKVRSVLFRDQVFTLDMKRAEEICDGIVKEGLDFEWRCETRVDRLSKDLILKMKKAGCTGINMGVETGDPELLKTIGKRGLTVEMVKQRFKEARECDIVTGAHFIIGLPGETKDTIAKTLELAKEIKATYCGFSAATPYPGTKLYEIAKEKGWALHEDFERYTGREVVMRTEELDEHTLTQYLEIANVMFSKGGKLETILSWNGVLAALSQPKKAIRYAYRKLFGNKLVIK